MPIVIGINIQSSYGASQGNETTHQGREEASCFVYQFWSGLNAATTYHSSKTVTSSLSLSRPLRQSSVVARTIDKFGLESQLEVVIPEVAIRKRNQERHLHDLPVIL